MQHIKLESKEYFEDMEWANQHYIELQPKYSDEWVAINNKKVIASGKMSKIPVLKSQRDAKNLKGFLAHGAFLSMPEISVLTPN